MGALIRIPPIKEERNINLKLDNPKKVLLCKMYFCYYTEFEYCKVDYEQNYKKA